MCKELTSNKNDFKNHVCVLLFLKQLYARCASTLLLDGGGIQRDSTELNYNIENYMNRNITHAICNHIRYFDV